MIFYFWTAEGSRFLHIEEEEVKDVGVVWFGSCTLMLKLLLNGMGWVLEFELLVGLFGLKLVAWELY